MLFGDRCLCQRLCLALQKALNGKCCFVARTLWSATVAFSELTNRIFTVFRERILPHQQSKLNEIAQSLGINLSNVINVSFFLDSVAM